jgi:uncharacterized protein YbcI
VVGPPPGSSPGPPLSLLNKEGSTSGGRKARAGGRKQTHMNSKQLETLPLRLSNAAAGVLAKRVGPGPTRVRAVVDGRTIVILFSDGLTKGERTQISRGHGQHVLATRQELQRLMRDDLVAVVEDQSSRSVGAFFAHTHLDPDVSIVVFMLEPDSPRQQRLARPSLVAADHATPAGASQDRLAQIRNLSELRAKRGL